MNRAPGAPLDSGDARHLKRGRRLPDDHPRPLRHTPEHRPRNLDVPGRDASPAIENRLFYEGNINL